ALPIYMTSRREGYGYAVVFYHFAIGECLECDLAEPSAQYALTRRGGEIVTVADASVVGMCMCDDGSCYRPPGVDVEIAGYAVQAFLSYHHQLPHGFPCSCLACVFSMQVACSHIPAICLYAY